MSRETVVREPFVVERHALAPANAPGAVEPALRLPVLVDRRVERETRFERQLATRTTHERIVYPVAGATRASPSRRGTRHVPAAAPRPPDLPAVLTLARPPAVTGPSGIATPSGPASSRAVESGTSESIAPATLRPAGQPPATPPGLSAAEVERLTDQVLARIEHRAVAQRERHGRH